MSRLIVLGSKVLVSVSVGAILLLAPASRSAVIWNEAVNGDLSNNQAAPTYGSISRPAPARSSGPSTGRAIRRIGWKSLSPRDFSSAGIPWHPTYPRTHKDLPAFRRARHRRFAVHRGVIPGLHPLRHRGSERFRTGGSNVGENLLPDHGGQCRSISGIPRLYSAAAGRSVYVSYPAAWGQHGVSI